ncbi:MAG: hypothetical protein ACTSPW_00130 [Promethearchaeota archaeon]
MLPSWIFKIILVGPEGSGKSSFLRICLRTADSNAWDYSNSLRVDFVTTVLAHSLYGNVKLQIWDMVGGLKVLDLNSQSLRGAAAYLLFFDLSDHDSFLNLKEYIKQIRRYSKRGPVLLIGTKLDLKISVSSKEIKKFIKKYRITEFIPLSNRFGFNRVKFQEKLIRIIVPEIECDLFKNNVLDGYEVPLGAKRAFLFRILNRIRSRKYQYKDAIKYLHPPEASCAVHNDLYNVILKPSLLNLNEDDNNQVPIIIENIASDAENAVGLDTTNISDYSGSESPLYEQMLTELDNVRNIMRNVNNLNSNQGYQTRNRIRFRRPFRTYQRTRQDGGTSDLDRLREEMLEELENLRRIMEGENGINALDSIDLMNLSDEEKQRAKDFITFFSQCPVCHKKNHISYLKEFYFSEDPQKIRLKEKLLRLMENYEEFPYLYKSEIVIGIPCCNCFKNFFNEEP